MSLEETIATHLRQRGWHLALAETTTGGIIAVRLVRLAGSSAYFDRSIVAYSKEAKLQSLGVDPGVFERQRRGECRDRLCHGRRVAWSQPGRHSARRDRYCWTDSRALTEATRQRRALPCARRPVCTRKKRSLAVSARPFRSRLPSMPWR